MITERAKNFIAADGPTARYSHYGDRATLLIVGNPYFFSARQTIVIRIGGDEFTRVVHSLVCGGEAVIDRLDGVKSGELVAVREYVDPNAPRPETAEQYQRRVDREREQEIERGRLSMRAAFLDGRTFND